MKINVPKNSKDLLLNENLRKARRFERALVLVILGAIISFWLLIYFGWKPFTHFVAKSILFKKNEVNSLENYGS